MDLGGRSFVWLLLVLIFATSFADAVKSGRSNITTTGSNLFSCERILFASSFTGRGTVKVFVSYNQKSAGSRPGASVWVKAVTTRGFTACVLEFGNGSNGTATLNWLAFQTSPQGTQHGSVDIDKWTSETKCKRVDFAQRFSKQPRVFGSIRDKTGNNKKALHIWVEDESRDHFKACLREVKSFSGAHENIAVDWFAYTDSFPEATYSSSLVISNKGAPPTADNYAFCQTVNFSEAFYSTPVVVITAKHRYDQSNANSLPAKCNAISAWTKATTTKGFQVCVVDYSGSGSYHDPITVDYAVLGDLDPCINVSCDYFAVCRAYGPRDPRCVCKETCPSYEEPVCSSNGTSYDNKCLFQQDICRLQSNYTLYHPGSCEGFPIEKGRISIALPTCPEVQCQTINFRPYAFYPDKPIQVQATVNHFNTSSKNFVHDPAVVWTENITYNGFDVCITGVGRGDRLARRLAAVDWLAYQGAPEGGLAGKKRIRQWWTGTQCETIGLPSGKFSTVPSVFVTAEHHHAGLKRNAALIWTVNITISSFKVCLRELQNFDGAHEDIYVSWFAFSQLHQPLFSEHGSIYFPNSSPPSAINNHAYCKDERMSRNYNVTPLVFISANHTTNNGNLGSVHNGFNAWLEYVNTSGFRVCIKQLYETRYDPLSVSYTIIPEICEAGWSFYNGYCYYTYSECTSWLKAEGKCRDSQAHLVSIHNQEENVYIQHRHAGEKAWIGYNDRSVEGSFRWASDDHARFTYWAHDQPNNFKNEDCVHTLGLTVKMKNRYRWNDVPCSDCHNYTCAKDYDECAKATHKCHTNARCTNTVGSYTCRCLNGFTGDGFKCYDINECSDSSHNCGANAVCSNTVGSHSCQCRSGYTGNGINCTDINECSDSSHNCGANAVCSNTAGSHSCQCRSGYTGNGITCTDIDECRTGVNNCHGNAHCTNTQGSYTCRCQNSYAGNGRSCTYAPECTSRNTLSGQDRKSSYGNNNGKCDKYLSGWYRFTGGAGTRMSTSCVPRNRCNTYATGWMNGGHPLVSDGQVNRTVCFHWTRGCCHWSQDIRVRNCGLFYVYQIHGTPMCDLRYCGTD